MPYYMKLPRLGAEASSARIVEWLKKDAEWVKEAEALVVVETNKISIEVEAPANGYLLRLKQAEDEVEVGQKMAILCATEAEYQALSHQTPADFEAPRPQAPELQTPAVEPQGMAPAADPVLQAPVAGKVLMTPLARKMAREHGLNAGMLTGSGPRGIIKKRDVLRAINNEQPPAAEAPRPAAEKVAERKVKEVIPLKGMRKRIAERLSQSLHRMAQFTDMGEIDVDALVAYRKKLVQRREAVGIKISYNAILLKMVSLVLREFPVFNAALIDDNIHLWQNVNIGFAVAVDNGLIVPVIHDCDRRSIADIQRTLDELVEKAKSNQLTAGDISNGTFTVSNFGSYGAVYGTPIINPPETALLGLGTIRQVPVIEDGNVVPRWIMNYSLTMDHRVIDGAAGGQLINRLRMLAETPELLSALW